VIVHIQSEGDANLLEVAGALRGLGLGFGAPQGGEQQTCENHNDRNHDQQLDQRKGGPETTTGAACGRRSGDGARSLSPLSRQSDELLKLRHDSVHPGQRIPSG
jgi:hypothetical protein